MTSAREIYKNLGYSNWSNFYNLIHRAKALIRYGSEQGIIEESKIAVQIGSGAKRLIRDFLLDDDALNIVIKLAGAYKVNDSHYKRNETIFLGQIQKYCQAKRITFTAQAKIGKYFFDGKVGENILLEFDEPHHDGKRQKNIDIQKNKFAISQGYKLQRFSLANDIIDAIIFLEKELDN